MRKTKLKLKDVDIIKKDAEQMTKYELSYKYSVSVRTMEVFCAKYNIQPLLKTLKKKEIVKQKKLSDYELGVVIELYNTKKYTLERLSFVYNIEIEYLKKQLKIK